MAEEIPTDTPIEQEVIETPQADVVETEPVSDGGRTNLQNLYEALKSDEVFSEYVPQDGFDSFVKAYKNPKDISNLYNALKDDSVFSEYMPPTLMGAVEYFGLGKPSAVPSASVGGGSATKGRGVEQPSSSQPNVDNQFGLGGIAAQVGKETELSKEVNAFENYEDKQSYFAKVDKAKREIVDNKNSSYVLPNTEEGQSIYKDATGLRYDFLKRDANAAQVKMSSALNPIINKDIDEKYLTKNEDGFLVPDVEKIDKYAKDLAKRYNLPEDGYLKEVIYNEAKSRASYKEIEPEVNKRFEQLIQPNLVATGLIEKSNQEVWKNFTTDEVEQAELDKKVGTLADDLKVKSKADQDAIQYELQNQVSNLDDSFNQTQEQITAQYANIDNQYKNGQLPYEQYTAAFNNLKQSSEQAYAAYSDDRLKLFDEGQKALNQINNKYNGQLRRQAEELNNIAREKVNKAALEYQKKYGKNPKLEAEIKKLYEKAYLETVADKNNEVDKYNKNRTTELVLKYKQFGGMAAMADRFLRSVDSAAGGSLKGLGTSLGINSLQVYGDFLQGSVTLPEAKTKEFKDLFDPMNLSQLSGQLAGGMAPMIAASAVVGAATQNAPLMYQMAATGAASFFTESADIAGRMHDETFATTQSAAKANEASAKSWESQYKIIPLYAFSGLPFIKAAGTWIKTLPRVSRVALGAAAEIAEEIPQEITQNIAEENIRAGLDPFDDYYKKISEDDWKRLKETAISVAPVALLGGAGQISGPREISNKKLMQQQVSSYAAQAKVNELVGNMQGQWVSQMVAKKGEAFAVTTINSLFADGTIDEQTRDQLQENVTTSKKNFEDAKTLGLSQSEGVVYDALTQAYLQKKAQFEQAQENGDEILADNLNQEMTNIRNQTKEFAQNKQGDFFVFQFEDGSQKIVTNSNWSSDAEILDLIASNQIAVSAYNENGKALLDSLKPKVEEQKVAQEERKVKKLEDDIEVGYTVDLTPSAQPTTDEAPQAESAGSVGALGDELIEFAKERSDVNAIYELDWEGYSDEEIKSMQDRSDVVDEKGKQIFEKYATAEEKKEFDKLGKRTIGEKLKKDKYSAFVRQNNYREDVLDRITKGLQEASTGQAAPQAAPQFEAPTIEAPTQEQEAAPQTLPEVTNEIANLREQEQAENEAIDPNDEVAKKEIYDKYDEVITPLLEQEKELKAEEKKKPLTSSEIDTKREELEEKKLEAKRRIARADDTELAIQEYNNAKKAEDDFEAELEKEKAKKRVDSLIEDEKESYENDSRYEYKELFEQDPRLAALQSHKDMLDYVKSDSYIESFTKLGISDVKERQEDSIKRNEEYIADLEADLKENPPKEKAKEETKKSEEKVFTYDKDGNIVEATVIAKGKNTTSILIDGKQTTRANTELFNNKQDAQTRLSETAEPTIFDDFDTTNKRTGLKGKVEANKAFREKYGEDAAVAKAISSNFEAIADELKAKGIFTKIKC
jgi:hypothetical protein